MTKLNKLKRFLLLRVRSAKNKKIGKPFWTKHKLISYLINPRNPLAALFGPFYRVGVTPVSKNGLLNPSSLNELVAEGYECFSLEGVEIIWHDINLRDRTLFLPNVLSTPNLTQNTEKL